MVFIVVHVVIRRPLFLVELEVFLALSDNVLFTQLLIVIIFLSSPSECDGSFGTVAWSHTEETLKLQVGCEL